MTDKILFIDKLGNLNETPLIYQVNNKYERKAYAIPNQDSIICGVVINGSVIKDFGSKPFFKNLTEIERYLCSNSTNTHSKIPSIMYRVAGVPIEFKYINPFFFYANETFEVHFDKFTPNTKLYPDFSMLQEFSISNTSQYELQSFNGLNWKTEQNFNSDTFSIQILSKQIKFYRLLNQDNGEYSKPFVIEPEKLLAKYLELTN